MSPTLRTRSVTDGGVVSPGGGLVGGTTGVLAPGVVGVRPVVIVVGRVVDVDSLVVGASGSGLSLPPGLTRSVPFVAVVPGSSGSAGSLDVASVVRSGSWTHDRTASPPRTSTATTAGAASTRPRFSPPAASPDGGRFGLPPPSPSPPGEDGSALAPPTASPRSSPRLSPKGSVGSSLPSPMVRKAAPKPVPAPSPAPTAPPRASPRGGPATGTTAPRPAPTAGAPRARAAPTPRPSTRDARSAAP